MLAPRPRAKKPLEAATCDAVALLRSQIRQAHELLDTAAMAAAERTRTRPALHGQVLSLYAHCVCIEDSTVNVLLRGMPPVFKHSWFGGRLEPWELASIRAYSHKVHTATNTLLAGLTPTDLRVGIDLSDAGLGWTDTTWVLNRFILWESATTCGALASKQLDGTTPSPALHRRGDQYATAQSGTPLADRVVGNGAAHLVEALAPNS